MYTILEENEMESEQIFGKDLILIDGMPASAIDGTHKTPEPWEE